MTLGSLAKSRLPNASSTHVLSCALRHSRAIQWIRGTKKATLERANSASQRSTVTGFPKIPQLRMERALQMISHVPPPPAAHISRSHRRVPPVISHIVVIVQEN